MYTPTEEIVLTNYDEVMTRSEAIRHNQGIKRIVTNDEAEEYRKEELYWKEQAEQFQHESSHHELND